VFDEVVGRKVVLEDSPPANHVEVGLDQLPEVPDVKREPQCKRRTTRCTRISSSSSVSCVGLPSVAINLPEALSPNVVLETLYLTAAFLTHKPPHTTAMALSMASWLYLIW
jgi:hypothetical protein